MNAQEKIACVQAISRALLEFVPRGIQDSDPRSAVAVDAALALAAFGLEAKAQAEREGAGAGDQSRRN